jgi:type II secretory pathway component GspD/PulD (secretin)
VVAVKYGSAKELAGALGQHYKGEAQVQVVPEPASNSLLLTAPEALLPDVVRTIEQLDRRPQRVTVDVWLVEGTPEGAAKLGVEREPGLGGKGVEGQRLSGPVKDVELALASLKKAGQVASVKHVQLTALENQRASLTVSESKPMVTGMASVGGGGFGGRGGGGPGGPGMGGLVQNIINYREAGTSVTVTPRVHADGLVTLELSVQESQLRTPEDGVALGANDKGEKVTATEVVTTTLNGRLSVASGQALIAKDVQASSKAKGVQSVVIVAARVAEGK